MAQDRLFHKRLGHSEKVNALDDFGYIVWGCYVLSADDYGVMRYSAVTLQADHDRLMLKAPKLIEKALDHCVELALVVTFDHQKRLYLCQLDWQDFQKIRYPSTSHNPMPPAEILARCTTATRNLFSRRTQTFSPISENGSVDAHPTRGEPPHESANVNANANGNEKNVARARALGKERRLEPLPEMPPDELAERAGRLLERYAELFYQHRRGARYRSQPALDLQVAVELATTWDDERLEKLATLVLTTDDRWISGTDRSFSIFARKVSWADDRLCEWESKQEAAL